MFSKVNQVRTSRGLRPLAHLTNVLTVIARRQSVRMAQEHALSHNTHIRADMEALGVHPSWTGENTVVSKSIDSAMEAFMASPHHLENIVRSNYTHLGVGVVLGDGVVWVTQDFAQVGGAVQSAPRPAPAAKPAPKPAATVAPVRTAPPTPKPTAKPTPPPSADPNAIEHGLTVTSLTDATPAATQTRNDLDLEIAAVAMFVVAFVLAVRLARVTAR